MTNFKENSTKVRRLTLDGILPGKKKVKIRFLLQDKKKTSINFNKYLVSFLQFIKSCQLRSFKQYENLLLQ